MRFTIALLVGLLCGCGGGGCLKDGSSAVSSVTTTISTQPSTNTWSVGITITFKEQPTPETVAKLLGCGATPLRFKSDKEWVIARYERLNAIQSRAIEASLKEGATLKRSK